MGIEEPGDTIAGRAAVCVDGENISGSQADRIRLIARKHGNPDTMRVYGNASFISGWKDTAGYRLIHSGVGKTATDILTTVDAMELVLREKYQTFLIASSDGDFAHLALRLRELGVTVIGIGEAKAPQAFRGACTVFESLKKPSRTSPSSNGSSAIEPTNFDQQIRSMIAANCKNGQGMLMEDLGRKMRVKHETKISTYPERAWRAYLKARPTLFELDPRGDDAKVRFLPEGFDT